MRPVSERADAARGTATPVSLGEARLAPLELLLQEAWTVTRRSFGRRLVVSAPGVKGYRCGGFAEARGAGAAAGGEGEEGGGGAWAGAGTGGACFPAVSVTGSACALGCDHCGAFILRTLRPAGTPGGFRRTVERLAERGGHGLLVTGGCTPDGAVPLMPYLDGLARAAELGLRVVVHTGLVDGETARGLREAGVAQVLLDLIGDAETIRRVYHLDRPPADYRRSLEALLAAGLAVVPHIVVGLHYGQVRGEWEALSWVVEMRPPGLVLVMLMPLPGTAMAGTAPPPAEEVARLAAAARVLAPDLFVSLGCARPGGFLRREAERLCVDAGVNAIAFPAEETLRHARGRGLDPVYLPECCSLPATITGHLTLSSTAARRTLRNPR